MSSQRCQRQSKSGGDARFSACRLLYMAIVVALLYVVSFVCVTGDRTVVVVCFAGLWIPLAAVLFGLARQRRQLVLVYFKRSSPWFDRLKGGPVMLGVRLIVALPVALGLLVSLGQGIGQIAWVGLCLTALVWAWVYPGVYNRAGVHLVQNARCFIAGRLTYWSMVPLLLAGLLIASFWVAVPDYSGVSAVEAFQQGRGQALAQAPWLHFLTGLWAGLGGLHYWFAELLSTGSNNIVVRFLIWCVVLLKSVFFVIPALLMMQGANSLADQHVGSALAKPSARRQRRALSHLLIVLAMLIFAVLLWDRLAPLPWSWLTGKTVVIEVQGTSYQLSPAQLDSIIDTQVGRLETHNNGYYRELNAQIGNRIDTVFASAIRRVPSYVDWYYSIPGQAVRATASVISLFSDESDHAVMRRLFPNRELDDRFDALNNYFSGRYQAIESALQSHFRKGLVKQLKPFRRHPHRKHLEDVTSLEPDRLYAASLADTLGASSAQLQMGTAAGVGVVVALARKQIGSVATGGVERLSTRLAGKRVAKAAEKSAARSAMRAVSRGAGRVLGRAAVAWELPAAACAIVGPGGSVACGVAAFAVVTVVTEYAEVKLDKRLHAEQLHDRLVTRLTGMRDSLKQQYSQKLHAMMANMQNLRQDLDKRVKPASSILSAG